MIRWLTVGLVVMEMVWTKELLAESRKVIPKRIVCVYSGRGKVMARPTCTRSDRPHYEVIEWSEGADMAKPEISGPWSQAEGKVAWGPDCSAEAVVYSVTVYQGFNSARVKPVVVKHLITVTWCQGKANAPEPKEGVTIYFHHRSLTNAEAAGAGLRNIVGSAHAKAKASTQGPGGTSNSTSRVSAPILGVDADPNSQDATYVLKGLKSGWKGYISVTVSAVGSTWIFGSAQADAFAQIWWEAEMTKGERK